MKVPTIFWNLCSLNSGTVEFYRNIAKQIMVPYKEGDQNLTFGIYCRKSDKSYVKKVTNWGNCSVDVKDMEWPDEFLYTPSKRAICIT